MNFTSAACFAFFTIFLLLYSKIAKDHRTMLLFFGSYVFYGFWDWRYLALLIILSVVNFTAGLVMHNSEIKKQVLLLALTFNMTILFTFKYFGFFVDNLRVLLASLGWQLSTTSLDLIIPLGISFYIFQVSSYSIDVYRNELQPTRDFVAFSAFVAYFPHMAAGPIMKAKDLLPQIQQPKTFIAQSQILSGLGLIALGLFKKVVIADTLAPMVNRVFTSQQSWDWKSLILASIAFGLQIYGDFSGYSNMARGVSRLLGIELVLNFRQPYFSSNIQEFWRRWHISLSNWFRDYLYIPLGGNRSNHKSRTYFNLTLVMLVAGIWHGAAWGFIVWGMAHGLLLVIQRHFSSFSRPKFIFANVKAMRIITFLMKVTLTNAFVFTLWVVFRNPDPEVFLSIFNRILNREPGVFELPDVLLVVEMLVLTILIDSLEVAWQKKPEIKSWLFSRPYLVGVLVGILVLLSMTFQSSDVVPFVYFQF